MKIGVIGGGQLGRMMALAGTPLGMNFAFLDPAPDACAQALGEHIRADYGDQDHLRQLADEVDLVTFEFESVPAETVAFLSQFVPVYPSADALRIARDRWFEKSMFRELGIPTPEFADIQSQADLDAETVRVVAVAEDVSAGIELLVGDPGDQVGVLRDAVVVADADAPLVEIDRGVVDVLTLEATEHMEVRVERNRTPRGEAVGIEVRIRGDVAAFDIVVGQRGCRLRGRGERQGRGQAEGEQGSLDSGHSERLLNGSG